jgi:hypothetical protein
MTRRSSRRSGSHRRRACSPYFSQEGSTREASFGFQVFGPRGQGQVDARTYITPLGSSATIWYDGQRNCNGSYPCR